MTNQRLVWVLQSLKLKHWNLKKKCLHNQISLCNVVKKIDLVKLTGYPMGILLKIFKKLNSVLQMNSIIVFKVKFSNIKFQLLSYYLLKVYSYSYKETTMYRRLDIEITIP